MVTIREKTVVRWRMEGVAASHALTEVSIRGLNSKIDEPLERGGTNLGMSPTETLVAALIGCTNVISHKIAHKNGIEIKDMRIHADVQFDRRGVTLAEDVAVPFPSMTLTIDLTSSATEQQIDRLRTELAMFCPVSKVIRASGTVITEVWNVTAP